MPAPSPRRTRLVTKLALAAGTFVALPLGLEALLRANGFGTREEARFEGAVGGFGFGGGIFVPHEERFYTLGSGYRATSEHLGIYATGDWPFRGAPPEPRPAELPRIAVVGDSNVYGVGVNVADSVPAQLQLALEEQLGLDPTQVQVAGFGVPAYSTVQIRHLLEHEVLSRGAPFALVLYLAAWNDHAPALGLDDVALRARRSAPMPWRAFRQTATYDWLRRFVVAPLDASDLTRKEILHQWSLGEPPLGRRVPEEDLRRELEAILDLATAACPRVVLVLGAQKQRTQRDFPGLARDREAVRSAALRRGLPCVDANLLYAAHPPFDANLCDMVHPSPRGARVLARGIADALHRSATERAWTRRSGAFDIARLLPLRLSALGDELVRVELRGWTSGSPAPRISVGFAPLQDLREVEDGVFEGRSMANAPGLHDVIVSARAGVARATRAVELLAPRLELVQDSAHDGVGATWTLWFRSRPGDSLRLTAGRARAEVPGGIYPGSQDELEPEGRVEVPGTWIADETGSARLAIPAAALLAMPELRWVRGLVVPRGTAGHEACWRYTTAIELPVPTR